MTRFMLKEPQTFFVSVELEPFVTMESNEPTIGVPFSP